MGGDCLAVGSLVAVAMRSPAGERAGVSNRFEHRDYALRTMRSASSA